MFDLIASVLSFFYDHTGSYGLAVMLLTLSVMVIVTPLTLSGTKSMIQMQRMQPEMKALQAEHKDDREKLNQEMMAFYQENGINPVGGCLPLFVQAPVFFVLYRVVSGLTRRVGSTGEAIGSFVTSNDTGMLPAPTLDLNQNFNPEYLSSTSQMAVDLRASDEMNFLTVDLADSALDALRSSLVDGFPYALMIIIVLISSLYQQKQIKGRSNNAAPVNPQQETIMKILPWFLPVISFTLPAALVVYFIISNLYRILQQHYITRTLYDDEAKGAKTPAAVGAGAKNKSSAGKSSADKSKSKSKGNSRSDSTSSKRTTPSSKPKKSGGRQNGAGRTTPKGSTSSREGPRREATVEPRPRKKKRK